MACELNFVGTGSAFNTKLGNNSAFIKADASMLLIDCGGSVFPRLMELKLLDGLKQLYIVISHTHPDHVGSLGDVIFYVYYMLNIKPTVIFPEKSLMERFLAHIGVTPNHYELKTGMEVTLPDESMQGLAVKFSRVSHVNTIPCYGFILERGTERCYYSGDANKIAKEVIAMLKNGELGMLYQDTCGKDYEGNRHLALTKLVELIPQELRARVCCMHQDESLDRDEVVGLGFQWAQRV